MFSIDLSAVDESRYDRQELIAWWDQEKLGNAKVILVGAGALGNEIAKTLALIGVGRMLIIDMDDIEISNLSRCVFFRESDQGENKATLLARRLRDLNPDASAIGLGVEIVEGAGLGLFDWADVIVSAVDNRAARVFINKCCALMGRDWVDGGIEELSGVVRAFRPHTGVCYECTMSATDRDLLNKRLSCAMLARRAAEHGRTASTAIASALIGGLQAQETVKLIHEDVGIIGNGLHINGKALVFEHIKYRRRKDCVGHTHCSRWINTGRRSSDTSFDDLLTRAEREFGVDVRLQLSRDIVTDLHCVRCDSHSLCGKVLGTVWESEAACPSCGEHRLLNFCSSVGRGDDIEVSMTLADAGLPAYDGLMIQHKSEILGGYLMDGDKQAVLNDM
jgi:adenylyltransferase/sulfurtransferase